MVAERRDYVALDWVAAEIGDALTQASTALDAYLQNPDDITRLRFCLTYIHQVYGTLKMVEFAGAALLAEEMETLAHALLADTLVDGSRNDALLVLKSALIQLPLYLQQLQKERVDRPTTLLGLINDLRALRGETLITESAIFSPMPTPTFASASPLLEISEGELRLAAGKLLQMYQLALLNYLRGHEPRENLNYLAKVCARLAKLAGGQGSEPLWRIAIALFEGLLNRSIALTPAVTGLLHRIEQQIEMVSSHGASALQQSPPLSLLKNLLYYIAASTANSRFINEIKLAYQLGTALPARDTAIDSEALRSIRAALSSQLSQLAEDLTRENIEDAGVLLLAELRRAQDTTALLGLNSAQQLLQEIAGRLQSHRNDFGDLTTALRNLATDLIDSPAHVPTARPLFNDSEEAQEQLDKAYGAVLLETRNGLEQAKEAIIEFVANQWRHQCLEDVPALLASLRGGLQLADMTRAANVLAACENYVRQDLLGSHSVPAWQLLDTLADAIASVDYYLERRAEGGTDNVENIIAMAEESVAFLGYPVDGRIVERPAIEPSNIIPFPTAASVDDSERYDDQAGLAEGHADEDADTDFTADAGVAASRADQIDGENLEHAAEPAADALSANPEATALDDAALEATSIEEAVEPLTAFETSEEFIADTTIADTSIDETTVAETAAGETIVDETSEDDALSTNAAATPAEVIEIASAPEQAAHPELPAFAEGEEPDPEIAEIFVEEAGEVLQAIDEYLPQWRKFSADAESLAVIRRAFHTLKGSGRMVGALQIGELAWSIENMLNRVIEGTTVLDAPRVELVASARAAVPALIAAFERRVLPDMRPVQPLIDLAQAMAREQSPTLAAPAAIEPEVIPAVEEAIPAAAFEAEALETAETPDFADSSDTEASLAETEEEIETDISFELPEPAEAELEAEAEVELEPEATEDHVDSATTVSLLDDEPAAASDSPADELIAHESALPEPPLIVDIVEPEHLAAALAAEEQIAEDEEETDTVLLEIFASEAITHLAALDDFLRSTEDRFGPAELDDNLQRALHTLKGSAHMAGVYPIAEIVSPIEHLIKDLRAAQLRADPEVLDLLATASALLRHGLAQLESTPFAPIPGADDWNARVALVYHTHLDHIDNEADAEPGTPYSASQLGQFLGDSTDLIASVSSDLLAWQEQRLPNDRHSTLAATIAQVGDQAEALNIHPITDLAQALQSMLRRGADLQQPDADFFDLSSLATDRLLDMLDRLAANQEPTPDETLLTLLQDYEFEPVDTGFAEPPLLDSVVEYAEFDTPQAAESTGADSLSIELEAVEPELTSEVADNLSEELLNDDSADERIAVEFDNLSSDDLSSDDLSANDLSAADLVPDIDLQTAALLHESGLGDNDQAVDTADAAALDPAQPEVASGFDSSYLDELLSESLEETLNELAETADAADSDFADMVDFEALGGETIDLDAAFAAPLPRQEDSDLPSATINEYLSSYVQPAPINPPPLPTTGYYANASDDSSSDDEIDAEILEIFLEEAVDLLEALDGAVHGWNGDRDNSIYLDELQRLLHTLKGGARLAGLKNLGNLSHNFETLLINAQQQHRAIDDDLMLAVQNYQDQLVRMVEAVKAGGREADAGTSIAEIDDAAAISPNAATTTINTPAPESDDLPSETTSDGQSVETTETDSQAGFDSNFDNSFNTNFDADDSGVIVPFVRPSTPHAAGEAQTTRITSFGDDIEPLPEMAASALLRRGTGPQEVVKISAQLLEQLVNLAGETSIARSRAGEQVSEFVFALDEMQITVDRLQEQVRRLDIETEAQVIHRQEQVENVGLEGFDPLEFDRYSMLQQLSRSLLESASDLVDIKATLSDKSRDMETLLVQQARINTELQEGLMRSRMVPFARMVPRLRRIVRQVAGELGKQVEFHINNAEGELDRTVLERIVAPLEHMLRNAVDHGLEHAVERAASGKSDHGNIQLSLAREGGEIALTLSDDGRGIDIKAVRAKAIDRGLMAATANLSDHEVLQFILESGFSTAKQVTQISGRGVGMDVVASEIKQLGGSLDIDSVPGQGTRFTVRLPFTVSVNRALMVSVGGDIYAIPLNSIEGIVRVSPFELEAYYQPEAPLFEYAGQPYVMRYMGALLRTGDRPVLEGQSMPLPVLLVRGTDHAVAVQVDGLMGSREIVVKTLGPQFGMVQGLSGATVLGDGSVVVILDLLAMIRADALHLHRDLMLGLDDIQHDRSRPQLVMVVDDSVTVRKVTSRFLERQGMEVMLAKDGLDAISLLQESERIPDVMLLDIEMPRMDGFEVASRLRHSSRWQDIPIIMITSRTGEKHRERAFSLGVNRYLGKPYQEMVLLDTIYELTGTTAPV